MGLLIKAASEQAAAGQADSTIREMEKALQDSLRHLPPGESSPSAGLTLLKVYGSFQRGCCLSLKEESYYTYASVGSDMETISIYKEDIYSPETDEAYFSINLQFVNEAGAAPAWIFPLSNDWNHVLLIIEEPASEFNPEAISRVISAVPGAFILSPEKGPGLLKLGQEKQKSLLPSGGEPRPTASAEGSGEGIQQEIQKFYGSYASIQGIVLEQPALPGDKEFSVQVNRIVSSLGTAMALPSRRCLVLFSNTIDRELLAHRLCKSLKTQALSVFMADNVQAVSDIIRPYS
jgi:hypothetical protein